MMELNESWIQIASLFLANAGLIIWFRYESRSDYRQCIDLIIAIHQEMKDFHGKLERQDADFKSHLKYANHGKRQGEK